MKIKNDLVKQVPVTFLYLDSIQGSSKKGTIFINHGFMSDRHGLTHDLEYLVNLGFLLISVDAVGHGERLYADFEKRFRNDIMERNFTRVVIETSRDVSGLIDELGGKGIIDMSRLGISGISMGGYVTYHAMCIDSRLKAGVPILGSPEWESETGQSPAQQIGMLYPRCILSITGGKDTCVPPDSVFRFHTQLRKHYPEDSDRIRHINYPESGHMMRHEDWTDLWRHAGDWFEKWL